MKRYQIGADGTLERSKLYAQADKVTDDLVSAIRRANGRGETSWREDDGSVQMFPTVALAVRSMLAAAGRGTRARQFRTVATKNDPAVYLHVLSGSPANLGASIPPAALGANGPAIRRTLAFHEELSLVFEDYKSLGLYAPRPIRAETPQGWDQGDPWPAGAYASEHAWACADDAGKGKGKPSGGYDTGPTLKPSLAKITTYVLANRQRLGMVDHIFDRHRWQAPTYRREAYTGSDPHDTHTHSAFGDHDGRKPPWL